MFLSFCSYFVLNLRLGCKLVCLFILSLCFNNLYRDYIIRLLPFIVQGYQYYLALFSSCHSGFHLFHLLTVTPICSSPAISLAIFESFVVVARLSSTVWFLWFVSFSHLRLHFQVWYPFFTGIRLQLQVCLRKVLNLWHEMCTCLEAQQDVTDSI